MLKQEMIFGEDLAKQFREHELSHAAAQFRCPENIMKRRDVFTDIHHGLGCTLKRSEAVPDIPHDLAVALLVFLKESGVLFGLLGKLSRE
ncbi:MAG: hypothetical protein BWY42_01133 [Candidatus Omnitrophica bacterium ADurb.Bin277]|nr:MAG: hypothetical protein BWY42_01133 [Candidatus Omnitrophica bacterium ADurb.Bin277]